MDRCYSWVARRRSRNGSEKDPTDERPKESRRGLKDSFRWESSIWTKIWTRRKLLATFTKVLEWFQEIFQAENILAWLRRNSVTNERIEKNKRFINIRFEYLYRSLFLRRFNSSSNFVHVAREFSIHHGTLTVLQTTLPTTAPTKASAPSSRMTTSPRTRIRNWKQLKLKFRDLRFWIVVLKHRLDRILRHLVKQAWRKL